MAPTRRRSSSLGARGAEGGRDAVRIDGSPSTRPQR